MQIARALAQLWSLKDAETEAPRWLLLDEPTAALDLKYQIALMQLLQQVAHAGWGIVAVLHDLHLVAEYADWVVLLKDGEVIEVGDPREILTGEVIQDAYNLDAPYPLNSARQPAPASC